MSVVHYNKTETQQPHIM